MIEFGILGSLEVVRDGERVTLPGARERAVLAFLLLHANEAMTAERIIGELWDAPPPPRAGKSLQVRIAGIRKALGAEERIVTLPSGYLLRAAPDELDLLRLERLADDARRGDPAEAAELLREALSLFRGPPLADFAYAEWAQPAIRRLEELRLIVLEQRIEADIVLGRHADVVPELQELVREHPLRERFCVQLMLSLVRSGRQGDALETYRRARATLVEELGIEPGRELRDLEARVLRQDPSLEPPASTHAPASVLVVSLRGRHSHASCALAELLVREPPRELILAAAPADGDLESASAGVNAIGRGMLAAGLLVRSTVLQAGEQATNLIRLADEQGVGLVLVEATSAFLDDPVVTSLVARSPCDVAVLVRHNHPFAPGPVLVPFAGAEHDWTAIELAAWIARAGGTPLRLAGPSTAGGDPSRLLANASLAVQRSLGVVTEPVLVAAGDEAIVREAASASLVVVGLSEQWRRDGLGSARRALAERAEPPVLIVRHGLRPGGLAPPESRTQFTWTVRPA